MKLSSLKIYNCPVAECPATINRMVNLTVFVLSGTDIKSIPSEIGELLKLTTLDVSSNANLASLPSSVGNLANLEHLTISQCKSLSRLPEDIRRCEKLVDIISIGNSIDIIPCVLSRIPAIKEILISEAANKLEELAQRQLVDEKVTMSLFLQKSNVRLPMEVIQSLVDQMQ
jgi:Leucine-rich repeat (LRR) protein